MRLFSDDSAQAGGLIMLIGGIFFIGFMYVAFGAIMNQFQLVNNNIMTAGTLSYSQDHYNAMDLLFKYWWGFPIFAIICFIVYGIKNALTKQPGQI